MSLPRRRRDSFADSKRPQRRRAASAVISVAAASPGSSPQADARRAFRATLDADPACADARRGLRAVADAAKRQKALDQKRFGGGKAFAAAVDRPDSKPTRVDAAAAPANRSAALRRVVLVGLALLGWNAYWSGRLNPLHWNAWWW